LGNVASVANVGVESCSCNAGSTLHGCAASLAVGNVTVDVEVGGTSNIGRI